MLYLQSLVCMYHSITGSRSNIAAHYDLGNDLYSLFLDAAPRSLMMYSSAIYDLQVPIHSDGFSDEHSQR